MTKAHDNRIKEDISVSHGPDHHSKIIQVAARKNSIQSTTDHLQQVERSAVTAFYLQQHTFFDISLVFTGFFNPTLPEVPSLDIFFVL